MFECRRFLLVISLISMPGCGRKTPELPPAPDAESPTLSINGIWRGVALEKKEDRKPINVEFEFADNRAFKFRHTDSEEAAASGTFENYMGKNLMLKLEQSNITNLGLAGSTIGFDFEQAGEDIRLSNIAIEYLLKRKTAGEGDAQKVQDPQNPAEPLLAGIWHCRDRYESSWTINFADHDSFWAIVENKQSKKPLRIAGKIQSFDAKTGSGELVVTEDSSPTINYAGTRVTIQNTSTNTMDVTVYPSTKSVQSEFGCSR
jgi:hypothetical protein